MSFKIRVVFLLKFSLTTFRDMLKLNFLKSLLRQVLITISKHEARNSQVGCLIQLWQHAKMQTLVFPTEAIPSCLKVQYK